MAYDGYSQRLSETDSATSGDYFSLFKLASGDWRGFTLANLLAYIQANLTFPTLGDFTKVYSSPTATGFSVEITETDYAWLILRPGATYATGTIKLPAYGTAVDLQEVLVTSTAQVTSLTVDKNGADAIQGAPTSISADGFFKMKYDGGSRIWYRVG